MCAQYFPGHINKVLVTTSLGSRGLGNTGKFLTFLHLNIQLVNFFHIKLKIVISEKKVVVYISPENMGNFLSIVKEKNFIEVVSRSISQVNLEVISRSMRRTF